MNTLVLWDIDGTLITNGHRAGTIYLDAVEQVTGIRPTERVGSPHGMTEGQLLGAILEANGLDVARVPEVYARLEELSRLEHEAGLVRERCAGIDAALAAVADRGWVNALLTGNGPSRARHKVLAAGIDDTLFDWGNSFFGHEAPTRHHLTARARERIAERAAVIIGDTPKDGEAADSAGIPFIAVATGVFGAEDLRGTSAIVVIEDFESGLPEVLDAIATLPARA